MTDRSFKTPYGVFTLNVETDGKMISSFEKEGFHQKGDIETLLEKITNDSIVLDVGAHVGTMTIPFSKRAKKVYAFEPVSTNIAYLKKNLTDNNVNNVEVIEMALGGHSGRINMVPNDAHNAGSYKVSAGDMVEMQTLDSFNLKPDLIKIDVEGFEPDVLEGAIQTIATYKPTIFFEFFMPDLRQHKNSLKRIEKVLKGYSFFCNGKRYSSLWLVSLLNEPKSFILRKGGLVRNILAIPRK